MAAPAGASRQAEALGAEPHLGGRFLARRVQDGDPADARPAAWSTSVDLPMPGSPPSRTASPGRARRPRTRSTSPMPIGCRGTAARRCRASDAGLDAPPAATRRAPARRPAALALTTVSTRVFHPPQARHWPSQRGKAVAAALTDVAARGRGHEPGLSGPRRASGLRERSMSARPRGPVDDDRRARLVAADEQRLRERVLDHVLDDAAQRPGAVVDVVAELDDVVLGLLR